LRRKNDARLTKAGKKCRDYAYNGPGYGDDETPNVCFVLGLGGIAMYRLVYWSGVTLFVAWSVFSALSALNAL